MALARRQVMTMMALGALVPARALAVPIGVAEGAPPGPMKRLQATSPDGLTISVQVCGPDGVPEILFIHGLGQCHLAWSRQLAALAGHHRLVTYDIRGHGESDKPLDPQYYTQGDRWADELATVMAAAGLNRPLLVCWSLGGLIASHYLRRFGDGGLAGVMFVSAVTAQAPDLFEPTTAPVLAGLASDRLESRIAGTQAFLDACFSVRPTGPAREILLAYNSMVPSRVHAAIQQLGLDPSADSVLRNLRVPVLAVHGAKDRLVSVAMSRRTASLAPHAELIVYPGAGHGPMSDAPDAFNHDLAEFRRRLVL